MTNELYTDAMLLLSPSQGVLLLPNGDSLDGVFSGEWTTGLKVTGTYRKQPADESEDKDRHNLL